MNSDKQLAITLMYKAFELYEQHEAILQTREQSRDRVVRMILSSEAAAMYYEANNTAHEADRFFRRIPGHGNSWSNITA